ncbi:electron transport complex subunit RsxC [Enterococcus faecalis]|nr:electron transport complex subunit RsxC [Enterococcus faecalis]
MQLNLKGRLGGVKLSKRKDTINSTIEKYTSPKKIILPMSMHIGKPSKIVVKENQEVKIGTLVGKKDGLISADIHSSVSGRVVKIDEKKIGGVLTKVVIIQNDFTDRIDPEIIKKLSLQDTLANSGIVGMGGAGFPTNVKFLIKENQKISTLIINAAECEPYVTVDNRLILEDTDFFIKSIQFILDSYNIPKAIIAIEQCSHMSIATLRKSNTDCRINLSILPNYYPQGSEKLILKNVLKRELPFGALPIDLGAVILNVSTIINIHKTIKNSLPLIDRVVTVSGIPIAKNKNILVRIGTPVEELINICGGFTEPPAKVLNGGPMMGKLINSLDEPVTKTTNLILALTSKESKIPKEKNCIKCSECINVCPIGLQPILISQAYRNNDIKKLTNLNTINCIDCGACSYICPSKIDLLEDIRNAKKMVLEESK